MSFRLFYLCFFLYSLQGTVAGFGPKKGASGKKVQELLVGIAHGVLPVKKTAANPVLCTELSDSNSTRSAFASEVIMDGASWPQYTPCFRSLSEPILLYTSTRSYSHSAYGEKKNKINVENKIKRLYWLERIRLESTQKLYNTLTRGYRC